MTCPVARSLAYALLLSFAAVAAMAQLGTPDRLWTQLDLEVPEFHDWFSSGGFTVGDFNGDGVDDLAIGAPYESTTFQYEGAVAVLTGHRAEGLSSSAVLPSIFLYRSLFGQDAHPNDFFGQALAAGDFDGDGFDDLAVGVVQDDFLGVEDCGSVWVYWGSVLGPLSGQALIQGFFLSDTREVDDAFGAALAAGDFDGDGDDELAIGVVGESVGSVIRAGAVHAVDFSAGRVPSDQWITVDPTLPGNAATNQGFGTVLTSGDYNGDGFDDLAIGAPYADGTGVNESVPFAGRVWVINGGSSGLQLAFTNLYDQAPGDTPEPFDQFGSALASGDFDGDGMDELVVGVPWEDYGPYSDEGTVHILPGSPTGPKHHGWSYRSEAGSATPGDPYYSENFGEALAAGDVDGDGYDDLVVGVPSDQVAIAGGDYVPGGSIRIYTGGPGGLSLASTLWSQETPGVFGSAEPSDYFGDFLALGDFDGNGFSSLVVAAPQEELAGGPDNTGAFHEFFDLGLFRDGFESGDLSRWDAQ